jgi:hypothetical protein
MPPPRKKGLNIVSTNPYEVPNSCQDSPAAEERLRLTALRCVRVMLVVLLVPAAYNLYLLSFVGWPGRVVPPNHYLFAAANALGLVFVALAIWLLGLKILEFIAGGLFAVAAKNSRLDDWNNILYHMLRRAPWLSVMGAVLWIIWATAFYVFRINYFVLSVPIGAFANLLGALFYVPLFYQWYSLERTALGNPPEHVSRSS